MLLKSVFKTGRKYMLFVFTSPNFKQFIFKLFFQPFHSERQFLLPLYRSTFIVSKCFSVLIASQRFDGSGESLKRFLITCLNHPTFTVGSEWIRTLCMVGSVSLRFCFYCLKPFRLFCKERFKTGRKYMLFLFSSPNICANFFENLFSTISFRAITSTASFQKLFSLSQNVFCINRYHSDFNGLGESPKALLSYPVFHFTYYDGHWINQCTLYGWKRITTLWFSLPKPLSFVC